MNSYDVITTTININPSFKLNAQVFESNFPFIELFGELLDKETLNTEERQTLQLLWSNNLVVNAWFKGLHFEVEENGKSRRDFLSLDRLVVAATQLLRLGENNIFNEIWESNQEIFQRWLSGQYNADNQLLISKEEALEFFKFALLSKQINVLNVMLDNNPHIQESFAKYFQQQSTECQSLLTVLMLIFSTSNEEIIIKFLNLNTQFKELLPQLANDSNYSYTLLRCIMLTNTSDLTNLMTYYLSVVNNVKPIIQVLADCFAQQTFVYHQIYALLNRLKELHTNVDSIDLSGDLKDCFNNAFCYCFPKRIFEEIADEDLKCFLIRIIILSGNIANINELQRLPINDLPAIVWYQNNARLSAGERQKEFLNVKITETFGFPKILTSDISSSIPLRTSMPPSHLDSEENLTLASESSNQSVPNNKIINYMLSVKIRPDSIVMSNEEFNNLVKEANQFVNELRSLNYSSDEQVQLQIYWKNNTLLRALFQGQTFCIVDEGILSSVRRIDFELVLKAIEATIILEDSFIQNDILRSTYFKNRNGGNLILIWLEGSMIVDSKDHFKKYFLTDQECKNIFLKLVETNNVNLLPILLQNTSITEWLRGFKDSQSDANMEKILLFMFKHANSELLESFFAEFPNFYSLLRNLASDSNYTNILLDALMDTIRCTKFVTKYLYLFSDVHELQTFRDNYKSKQKNRSLKVIALNERIEYLLRHSSNMQNAQSLTSHDSNKKRKHEVEDERQSTKKAAIENTEKNKQSNYSAHGGNFFHRHETSLQNQKGSTSQTVNTVIEQPQPQIAMQVSSSEIVLANAIKILASNPSRVVTSYMQSISTSNGSSQSRVFSNKTPCPKPADIPRLENNKAAEPQHKESSSIIKPYRGN